MCVYTCVSLMYTMETQWIPCAFVNIWTSLFFGIDL